MANNLIAKFCTKCKVLKTQSEFRKHRFKLDGLQSWCKDCVNRGISIYRLSEQGRQKSRLIKKKYKQSAKGKLNDKKYRQSDKGKLSNDRRRANYRKKHPNAIKAHHAIGHAIETGHLPKATSLYCHNCGKDAEQYHHHKGYTQEYRLDVVPVCLKCHVKIHSKSG